MKSLIFILLGPMLLTWGCNSSIHATATAKAEQDAMVRRTIDETSERLFRNDLSKIAELCSSIQYGWLDRDDQSVRRDLIDHIVGLVVGGEDMGVTSSNIEQMEQVWHDIDTWDARRQGVDLLPHCGRLKKIGARVISDVGIHPAARIARYYTGWEPSE